MNLIRPSYEIIEQGPGLQGIYDIIENAGKTSYKSEVKGGETARKFVEARSKEGHGAVLEFGTVYLTFNPGAPTTSLQGSGDDETKSYMKSEGENIEYFEWSKVINFYRRNKYSKVTLGDGKWYVTTNYRVLVENNRLDDLKYLCEPTEYHEKRYCVRFIVDRFTGEEFLRHRVFSFCRESSRYCNYSKEKFGGNITFIIPPWIPSTELAEGENITWWDGDWVNMNAMTIVRHDKGLHSRVDRWLRTLSFAEDGYMCLTNDWKLFDDIDDEEKKGWQAQQARTVLPCAIKSPLAMCGFASDWVHFFHLRALGTTGAPHPQAKELAEPLMKDFISRGYLTDEALKIDNKS